MTECTDIRCSLTAHTVMADSSHNESRLKSAERQNMADPIHSVAGSSLTLPSHSETGPKSAVTSSIADPSRIGDGLSSPVRPSNLTIEIPHTGASAPAPFEHHGIQFGTFDEDGNPPTPPYIASADSTYHTAREFAERSVWPLKCSNFWFSCADGPVGPPSFR